MGALDDLMAAGGQYFDNEYKKGMKRADDFRANPIGHLVQGAMTGLSLISPGLPRPLPPGGAPPPPGNYFRPSPPPDRWMSKTADPVASMKGYAEGIEGMDPKIIASQLRRFWGDEALPYAERQAATNPAFGEVAGLLRRNQSAIEKMTNPDAFGPWGAR